MDIDSIVELRDIAISDGIVIRAAKVIDKVYPEIRPGKVAVYIMSVTVKDYAVSPSKFYAVPVLV